jgi:hypothetical protein
MRYLFIFTLLAFVFFSPIAKAQDDSSDDGLWNTTAAFLPRSGVFQEMASPPRSDDEGFVVVDTASFLRELRELHEPPLEARKTIKMVIKNGQQEFGGINAIALEVIAKKYQAFFPYDEGYESLERFPHDFITLIKGYHVNIAALAPSLYSLSPYFNAASIDSYHGLCTSVITSPNKGVSSRLPMLATFFSRVSDTRLRQLVTNPVLSSQAADEEIRERLLCLFAVVMIPSLTFLRIFLFKSWER